MKKIFIILFLSNFFIHCGFQPIYSERSETTESDYETVLISENSVSVKEAFNSIFKKTSKKPKITKKKKIES